MPVESWQDVDAKRTVLAILVAIGLTIPASFGFLPSGPTSAQVQELPPSGALMPAPPNALFDAAPSALLPGRLDSNGEQTGAPPEWQASRGDVIKDRGSRSDHFARLSGEDATLVSGAFTLSARTKRFSFSYRFFEKGEGENRLRVFILSDPSFATETEVKVETCDCATEWRKAWVDVSRLAGQNVKVKFVWEKGSAGAVGIDDVAADLLETKVRYRSSAKAADPVDTSTGNFTITRTDLAIPYKGLSLEFTRFYNSQSARSVGLGLGWTHTYAWEIEDVDGSDDKIVHYPNGKSATFEESGGDYTAPAGNFDTLECPSDCTLTTKGQIVYSFDGPDLDSIVDRNGNTISLTYTSGKLTAVSDGEGRSLDIDWSGSVIDTVTDSLNREVAYTVGGSGLAEVVDVTSETTTYSYGTGCNGGCNRLISETDPLSHDTFVNTYDTSNRVIEQSDELGNITCFYYGPSPSTTANCTGTSPTPDAGETVVVDPRGNETTYSYDEDSRTYQVKNALNDIRTIEYDEDDNPICVTDELDYATGFEYDGNGNVTEIINALNTDANCELVTSGVSSTFTYTSLNDVDLATDVLGRQMDFVYDGNGNLTAVLAKDATGSVKQRTCFTVDSSGLVTEKIQSTTLTDCTGNKAKFEYDDYGSLTGVINPRFSSQGTPPKTTFTYDLGGRQLTATNELSHTTTYTYDDANRVLSVEDELGNTASKTYDDAGRLATSTDALSNVTTFTYDNVNRLTRVTDDLGGETDYAYDENGNRTSVTDASNHATTYTYDALNRLTVINYPSTLGNTNLYYDAASRLTKRVDGDDAYTTAYTYDALGRVTEVEYRDDDDGTFNVLGTVEYDYDELGNRTEMVDDSGATTYVYDALNRLTSVTFPGDDTVEYTYDNVGNRSSMTYPDDKVVDYTYDEANNLETVTDWLDNVTSYSYDDAGKLVTTTLPSSTDVTTTFGYDNADRLTSVLNQRDTTTLSSFEYTLNAAGNRTQVVDGTGTTTYEYDGLHRLSEVVYPDAEINGFTYDAVGNRTTLWTGEGVTTSVDDAMLVTHHSFGSSANWTPPSGMTEAYEKASLTVPNAGGISIEANYATQAAAGPTGIKTATASAQADTGNAHILALKPASGSSISFRSQSSASATSITGGGGGSTGPFVISKPSGTVENDVMVAAIAVRPNTVTITPPSGWSLVRRTDNTGGAANSLAIYVKVAGASEPASYTWTISTSATGVAGGIQAFSGVDTSNPINVENGQTTPSSLEHSTPTTSTSYTYDSANRMTAAGGVSYGYDVRGNQTSRGSDSFEWDHESRLTEVVIDSVTSTYEYNGDGLRMSKTVDSTTTSYVWDIAAAIPVVIQDGTYTYLYGLGLISITDASDEQVYCLRDALGSTANLVDADGQVLVTYAYDVFGAIRSQTGSSDNVWLFAGEQRDSESGYDFLRARYYDPAIGRFLSRDPAGQGNFFSYVGNNPVNATDPSGLCYTYSYYYSDWIDCQRAQQDSAHLDYTALAVTGVPLGLLEGLGPEALSVAREIVSTMGIPVRCYDSDDTGHATHCSVLTGHIYEWWPMPSLEHVGFAQCNEMGEFGVCAQATACGWPRTMLAGACEVLHGSSARSFCAQIYCAYGVHFEGSGSMVPVIYYCGEVALIGAAYAWWTGGGVVGAATFGCVTGGLSYIIHELVGWP